MAPGSDFYLLWVRWSALKTSFFRANFTACSEILTFVQNLRSFHPVLNHNMLRSVDIVNCMVTAGKGKPSSKGTSTGRHKDQREHNSAAFGSFRCFAFPLQFQAFCTALLKVVALSSSTAGTYARFDEACTSCFRGVTSAEFRSRCEKFTFQKPLS